MTRPLEITRGPGNPWPESRERFDGPWDWDRTGRYPIEGRLVIYCPPPEPVEWDALTGSYRPIEWPEDYDSDPLTTAVSFAGTVLFCVTVWAGAALGFVGVIDLVAKAVAS